MIRRLLARLRRYWLTGHSGRWSSWRDLGGARFEHTRSCVCGYEEREVDG